MRRILILGSGKYASYLIKNLLDKLSSENLLININDLNKEHAKT